MYSKCVFTRTILWVRESVFLQGGVTVGGTPSKQGRCSQPLRSVHPFQSPPTFLGNVCDCLLLIIE